MYHLAERTKKISALILAFLLIALTFTSCKSKEENDVSSTLPEFEITTGDGEPVPTLEELQAKIKEAQEINPKVYAWLVVPGLNISEPIVYDQDNNNQYWEKRNLAGEEVANGTADVAWASKYDVFGNNSKDDAPNNVIFGHNWNNIYPPYVVGPNPDYAGFAQLASFTEEDFASTHQYIYLGTEKEMRIYKVFTAMNTESDWTSEFGFNYINPEPGEANFATLIDEMKQRSFINYDTAVTAEDHILTLSTCTLYEPTGGKDQRYVVSAVMLKSGESETEMAPISVNTERKQPSF